MSDVLSEPEQGTSSLPAEELDDGVIDDGGEAAVYPAPDEKRIGVATDRGTPPGETDQGDEEAEKVAGTPDDVSDADK
ncbi:MAG: hypothetical protein KBD66_01420 [Candidatus Doudnabacteria bacterium]|nr:hypothetical protein [Candidatus Doudnabacteria bacterium]